MQKIKKVLSVSMDDTVVSKSLPDFLSFANFSHFALCTLTSISFKRVTKS